MKTLQLYKLPKLLIIQLKRFAQTHKKTQVQNVEYTTVYQEKIDSPINFPLSDFDVRPYVLTLKKAENPVLYDLFGVSNHFGNLNGGHYTAFVRNFLSKKWHCMNDSQCAEISEDQVVTPAAYLLFYQRREE